jgi:Fic-DOC domain mobile mystery protein B
MSSKSAISGRAVTDLFQEPNDATPLEPEEKLGLKQTWITYRRDLNEAEQENIVKGAAWARSRRQRNKDVLNEDFAKLLHKRMFSDVWHWAGTYRLTERNIGIAPHRIANGTGMMFDDVNYWSNTPHFLPTKSPCDYTIVLSPSIPFQRQRSSRAPDGRSPDRTSGRTAIFVGRGHAR